MCTKKPGLLTRRKAIRGAGCGLVVLLLVLTLTVIVAGETKAKLKIGQAMVPGEVVELKIGMFATSVLVKRDTGCGWPSPGTMPPPLLGYHRMGSRP
jgi:hypothetical protein